MPDPAIQSAKRSQAILITVYLAALTAATVGLYRVVHRGTIAFRHGEAAFARHDDAAAVASYRTAYAAGVRLRPMMYHFTVALLDLGRPADALDLLLPYLQASPDDPSLRNLAAGAAQAVGRPDVVLPLYDRLGPRERLPLADLVRLADLNQQAGHLDAAIACARLARDRAPATAVLDTLLGQYLARAGYYDEAVASFQTALRLAPADRAARLALARALTWSQHYAEAILAYQAYLHP